MKTLLLKSAVAGLMTVLAVSTADAWQCRVHNARSQVWYGTGVTRSVALANAMAFCSRNSAYARNCIVDYCNTGGGPVQPVGGWQCNVTNSKGQLWVGTGPSRASALSNAMGFCSRNSVYARNCVVSNCFVK